MSNAMANECIAITKIFDRYIAALQTGNAAELQAIYHPAANFLFYRENKLVGGGIDILYKMADGNPQSRPIVYQVTAINVSRKIATATLDISDLGGVHLIDMFTLVKDDNNEWKIASKVAQRPNE